MAEDRPTSLGYGCKCLHPQVKDKLERIVAHATAPDISLDEIDELLKLVREMPACSRRILERELADQQRDEEKATYMYAEMADMAEQVGEHNVAKELKKIAGDESRHEGILNSSITIVRHYREHKPQGFDVTRHKLTDPAFGTKNDWEKLLEEVKTRHSSAGYGWPFRSDVETREQLPDEVKRWLLSMAGDYGIT